MSENKFFENNIERLIVEKLQSLGYNYLYGQQISAEGEFSERRSYSDVLLRERFRRALSQLNPNIPEEAIQDAFSQVSNISASEDLLSGNEAFHKMLTQGIRVSYYKDGTTRGDLVRIIDFDNIKKNDFTVVNQFTVVEHNDIKKPDIILFVNGLPLVVIELKNSLYKKETIKSAYNQLQAYINSIPKLFIYNSLCVISDGIEAKSGSLSAAFSRFLNWKTKDRKTLAPNLDSSIEILIQGQLNKATLTDIIRHFTLFDKSKIEDPKRGITTINIVKRVASYHQYYGVNKAVESSKIASLENGNRKAGVIWHTQGSGKSLSMVFYAGKIVRELNNPTVLVIIDKNDFGELFHTFTSASQLLRQTPVKANDKQHLKTLLKVTSGGVIFTTIQKFQIKEGNEYERLTDRKNVIVIANEADKIQYGFRSKKTDDIDENGNVIKGQPIVYGFAKYMRDALPNATYLGFTGTPIDSKDINTFGVFGNYVDTYDIEQSINDGLTLPVFYESRFGKVNLSEQDRELVGQLDEKSVSQELVEIQKPRSNWARLEASIGSESRIKNIAKDIVDHFIERQSVFEGKAIVVAMSRRIVMQLYDEIIAIMPEWHDNDVYKGVIKAVVAISPSVGSSNTEKIKYHAKKQQRRTLALRMKDPYDQLKIVIVTNMWLTGFDVPSMHTLYIYKPLKGYKLMQAIARVNRIYKDKPGGLVVDYLGLASDFKKSLDFYGNSRGKGNPVIFEKEAEDLFLEKIKVVSQMFLEKPELGNLKSLEHAFVNYKDFFSSKKSERLKIILTAQEHILSLDNGKKRFIDEVTSLSKLYVNTMMHSKVIELKDEIALFQALKVRLSKYISEIVDKTDYESESLIHMLSNEDLFSEEIVDVFDAAGIKKPEGSVLSEEFLIQIKQMQHQNTALEVLKKILREEIKYIAKINTVQGESLREILENTVDEYRNKTLTNTDAIERLASLAKQIKELYGPRDFLGLTDYELIFYDIISQGQGAKEVLGDEQLRDLAVYLADTFKNNISVDWVVKESVRAKLKVLLKRGLRKYGYPIDQQKLITRIILNQARFLPELLS
ncbi:type I restriction endonuclease subunit R [Ichthyobacterium seriolicida]|uniref:Type I restriction enzyme endonuclease subunit n=1 Tax=Ichthyobacterium seriolicida TaxID=242600 RepID=A0A1J1E920_9FLAO|nr:type I restriction endonuclease subunit R [Ichthyobacterium seriolicida]BAV94024.1 type I restriction-modification system, restriction subunit R [Ichthyobacterium seriolicida]